MKIHEKIRSMRQSKGWTQEEMAEKLGVSLNGYAKVERGETEANIAKLEQIAKVFNVDLIELLTIGDRNVVFLLGDNNPTNSNNISHIIGESKDLIFELHKLQLSLDKKDLIIEQQAKEIAYLKEIIELIRNKNE